MIPINMTGLNILFFIIGIPTALAGLGFFDSLQSLKRQPNDEPPYSKVDIIAMGIIAAVGLFIFANATITACRLTQTHVTKSATTKVIYNGKNPDAVAVTQIKTAETDAYDKKITTYAPTDTRLVDVLKTKLSTTNKLKVTIVSDKYDKELDVHKVYFENTPPSKNVSKIKLVTHETRSKSNWSIFTLVEDNYDLIVETSN